MIDKPVLEAATPIIPAGADLEAEIAFYERLGFTRTWHEGDMAGIRRDAVEILLFRSDDTHLAEWTSFRVRVANVGALYAEWQSAQILAANSKLEAKPWGTMEFTVLDPAGVCITFFQRGSAQ